MLRSFRIKTIPVGHPRYDDQRITFSAMLDSLTLTPRLGRQPASIGWHHGLVVPLNLGGKDRLEPLAGAAADDPSVRGGYRASKVGGELRGSQGKAFVPSHASILPRENKNAMRKIKACDPIRNAYSLRMSNTLDQIAEDGMNGVKYDFGNYDELTYSAWLIGRKMAGKQAPKESKLAASGCDSGISEHPSNWR